MAVKDLFRERRASENWLITDSSELATDQTIEADVIIVGTGAGGGVTAEILSQAGLNVVMLEEGQLKSSDDFKMEELTAYSELYQESAGRTTKDGAISIFQGRTVGGTTVVNWTSSFRTPEQTLSHWGDQFAVKGFSKDEMAPWFEAMEKRLNVAKWALPPNENNAILQRGCAANGYHSETIPRNVAGCWNLGYCGMGCPTNAKQSMLVTTIPEALKNGARLYHHTRAEKLVFEGNKAVAVQCLALSADTRKTTGVVLTFRAPHIVLAGGAINTPGLLLRSKATDPYQRIGKRTTIHPVNASVAMMEQKVEPFYGAPQSIYSDHFQWLDKSLGFKLEVPPVHPAMGSQILGFHGYRLMETMDHLPNMQATIALMRDGFHEESQGGTVELNSDGSPTLDYPVTPFMWQGLKQAYNVMAEIQFAAGAKRVYPLHHDATYYTSLAETKAAIAQLPEKLHRARLMTAHLMGGCGLGEDLKTSVVNSAGKFHHYDNLYVIDGSVFPTSIGANPQLSIYAMAMKQATALVKTIRGLQTV